MAEFDIGGATIVLPDNATPEQRKAAIAKFRQSDAFDKIVDKSRGAPARVRMIVGSSPIKDRLANVKRFYPDAVPYGDDNFVFTDPETGRPTLYNPPGFDVFGDVASIAREGAQMVGGTMGAVAGVPEGPVGVAVGAGLGSAVGGNLFDISQNLISGRIDTRGPVEAVTDTALDFAGGAVGQRAGDLISQGAKALIGGGKEAAKGLVDAFKSLKVQLPAGAVSGSKAVGTLEKALESSPFSASVMQDFAEKTMAQTKAAAEKVASQFGKIKTPQGAGSDIREAAKNALGRFTKRQDEIYSKAFDLVGPETNVAVKSVTALRERMEAQLAKAPGSLKKTLGPAIQQLKALEADAGELGIPFATLRQIRTNVGRDLDTPVTAGSTGSQNEAMKQVYGALTEDMSAAAKTAGPKAAKALTVADRFTRAFMTQSRETLEKIAKFDADEEAFKFALSGSKDGGSRLAKLRRNFKPEEWDTVAGTVLGRMGLAKAGGQDATQEVFSVNTFLTRWSDLSKEAKAMLFSGTRYRELGQSLDDLVKVTSSLKEMEKLTNTSNTARNLIAFSAIQTFGAALGGLAFGNVEGAGGGALVTMAATVVAPRTAAKLITNPRFVSWLTTPVTSPNAVSAHIGRLVSIAGAEPQIRQEIEEFTNALRSVPEIQ